MHLTPLTNPPAEPTAQWDGITPPSRRGGPSRSITDVLVELGFVERSRADMAIEHARLAGGVAEKLLLDQKAITRTSWPARSPSATAWTTST
jgi:hypothetical protein